MWRRNKYLGAIQIFEELSSQSPLPIGAYVVEYISREHISHRNSNILNKYVRHSYIMWSFTLFRYKILNILSLNVYRIFGIYLLY